MQLATATAAWKPAHTCLLIASVRRLWAIEGHSAFPQLHSHSWLEGPAILDLCSGQCGHWCVSLSPDNPHKHLSGAHAYIVSGKLQVRDTVLNAGDYVYEPSGVLHGATTALEDTVFTLTCDGPVLFFDDNGFTGYTNWETIEKLREDARALKAAE